MMLESIAMGALAAAGWLSFDYAWWRPAVDWRHPRILMYHMVSPHRPNARFNKLRVPPAEFERQIRWLRERGFTFIFASELLSPQSLPARPVCLTFDDGYEDNLLEADPILARHGAKATLYLVSQRDGGWSSKKKTHHSDAELESERKLTDDQVRSMLATRRWELGGHTRTHPNLCTLPSELARDEISHSRTNFREAFGSTADTFAYPFGLFDQRHADIVREAGYLAGLTTNPGVASLPYADPMRLPRIKVSGRDNLWGFKMRMRGGKRGLLK